ncbi:TPA: TrbI F-type domain-containing protein [Pasteurella multocida]|nr:TrbI F-type domain-containing protein [Pasteurella multocida]
MNKTLQLITVLLLIFGVFVLSICIYLSIPRFVVFNLKSVTDTFLTQVAELDLSTEQRRLLMQKYEQSLNAAINEVADGRIVLVSGAVVSSTEDITNEVKSKLAEKMKTK